MDKISALMDGELDEHQARQQIARLKQDESLVECWHAFHVVGDALRGEGALSGDFGRRLSARLAEEPTVLAPHRSTLKNVTTYALSAAASLSAVAVVGWLAFFNNPLAPPAELAQAPGTPAPVVAVPASAQLANLPSDGKMNEYLIAHQEFSPSTAIQGLAPYIRGVSGAQPAQGR
jgi:sigma-E factor negative regulatory protein RseA